MTTSNPSSHLRRSLRALFTKKRTLCQTWCHLLRLSQNLELLSYVMSFHRQMSMNPSASTSCHQCYSMAQTHHSIKQSSKKELPPTFAQDQVTIHQRGNPPSLLEYKGWPWMTSQTVKRLSSKLWLMSRTMVLIGVSLNKLCMRLSSLPKRQEQTLA